MFFYFNRYIISISLFICAIILFIIFDNQNIRDNELCHFGKKKKKSLLKKPFYYISDLINFLIPGAYGKTFAILVITTVFLMLKISGLFPASRFSISVVSGLIITFPYLVYRRKLSCVQKKLYYNHHGIMDKKGLYSSGDDPHMGEVVVKTGQGREIQLAAGIYIRENVENMLVSVKEMTKAGTLIVEPDDKERCRVDMEYQYESPVAGIKKLFIKIKNTISNAS